MALKIFPITYAHSPLHTDTFSIVHEAERTRIHQQNQNDMNLNVCIRTKFVEANVNLAKWIETESSFFQYFCSLRNWNSFTKKKMNEMTDIWNLISQI